MKNLQVKTHGPIDERSMEQLIRCMEAGDAAYGVLCADHHPGYAQPIGSAIGYREQISVSGVGYDIGCGNSALQLDIKASEIAHLIPRIMDKIVQDVSFGMGRKNNTPIDLPVLDSIRNADFVPQRGLLQLASDQLGTVGGGNHYVDLFYDDNDYVWIGVHFGSRGFGHKTASGFLALSQGKKFDERGKEGEMDSEPVLFDISSTIGQDYIAAMTLAGEYAQSGRAVVLETVRQIVGNFAGGAPILKTVNNHHNFAWKENHFGEDLWVVRKGCTPLGVDKLSFIGANMRDTSVIVKGIEGQEADESLRSTVHGAGRIMSRRAATGKTKWINGVKTVVKPGLVDWDKTKRLVKDRLIELRGGGPDEAPQVYKNLHEVLGYHSGSTQEVYALYPMGVAMAGDEFDAYKD